MQRCNAVDGVRADHGQIRHADDGFGMAVIVGAENSHVIVFAGIAGSLAYSPERDRLDNPHIYDPFNHVGVSPLIGMRWQWEQGAQPARVVQAQAESVGMAKFLAFR